MSQDQSAIKAEVVPYPEPLTQRHLAQLLLDVGTSNLVVKGTLPGRLTPEQEIGLQKAVNAPLTDEDFDAMDRESEARATLTKAQVYIILILLFECQWDRHDIAKAFNLSAESISSIHHMKSWPGTFQRYARDRNLNPYDLAHPPKSIRSTH